MGREHVCGLSLLACAASTAATWSPTCALDAISQYQPCSVSLTLLPLPLQVTASNVVKQNGGIFGNVLKFDTNVQASPF